MNITQKPLSEQLKEEQNKVLSLSNEIAILKEQLEWFKRNVFGKQSEKIDCKDEKQLEFDGFGNLKKSDKNETYTVPEHTRQKNVKSGKDKIVIPENLPTEESILDIPEQEKICKETGVALVRIGEEVTTKLAYKPGSYFLKKIIRPKYAVPKKTDQGVITANLPDFLLEKCMADESFLADILVKKYADHLPLYRQSEILSRLGILISRQLLTQWTIRAAMALKPLYELMKDKVFKSDNIFVDETPVKFLSKGKSKEAYVWLIAGGKSKDPPYRIYKFYENRKHCNAKELLKGYKGVLHSDKYGAYESLANKKQFDWCPCFSHIRRKFFEAESGDPKFRDWVLMKIRHLFMYEKVAWTKSAEERLKIRVNKEVPIIDALIDAIKDKLVNGRVLPKSKLRIALGYFMGLTPYLKNYTKHPFARLDNNVAERAIRPLAIGRKNWLFFGSENGGEAASIIFSLVQTCRALGINPGEYLEDVMRRFMSHPYNKLNELLPDQWAKSKGIL